jgi:putative flavoprotein involved in K+ transport
MSQAGDERPDALVLDVLVVGAGQAGLATGYFLQRAGVRFLLLDGGARVGDSWRRRYDSLVLFSPRSFSALPDLVMPGDPDGYPTKDEMANYLEQYANLFRLPLALQENLACLERRGDYFVGRTNRGRHLVSRAVIVATGPFQRSAIPRRAASMPPGITHLGADTYRNPAQMPSGRVLVVGGGGSGRQIALELTRSHEVSLSVGTRITITPQRVLGRDVMVWFDRLGFLRADKATARGRFVKAHQSFPGPHLRDSALRRRGVHLRPRTAAVTSEALEFADGSRATFEAVIWACGYEDRSGWLQIPGTVEANGTHVEDRGVSPIPGLYYVGRSWQTSRASALLCGVAADASRIVAQTIRWLRRDVHPKDRPRNTARTQRARVIYAGADAITRALQPSLRSEPRLLDEF